MIRFPLLALLTLTACGNAQGILGKATATAAVFVSKAADALDIYDAGKVNQIRAVIHSGTNDDAEAAMRSYLPKYKAARAALEVARGTVETALNAYDALKMATNKSKDLVQWIGLLMKAVSDVVAAFAAVGLNIPGVQL